MKYLCLCYYDQAKFEALSKSELEAVGPACRPHDEALRDSGHLMLVGSLAEAPSSRTLRPGSGRPSVTDGPYAATGEPLGAFFIIEAHDMDDAMEVASKTRARIWADISEAGSRCGRSTCSISRSHGGAAREDGHLGRVNIPGRALVALVAAIGACLAPPAWAAAETETGYTPMQEPK
jgi:hypothetical protein